MRLKALGDSAKILTTEHIKFIMKESLEKLTDETKVRDTKWRDLKQNAMLINYSSMAWFQALSALEKK